MQKSEISDTNKDLKSEQWQAYRFWYVRSIFAVGELVRSWSLLVQLAVCLQARVVVCFTHCQLFVELSAN